MITGKLRGISRMYCNLQQRKNDRMVVDGGSRVTAGGGTGQDMFMI